MSRGALTPLFRVQMRPERTDREGKTLSFDQMGLSAPLLQALAARGYTEATPIQTQAIPPLLEGHDLLGIAQTGTGKTAAFLLPAMTRMLAGPTRPQARTCRMLVLAPTRELAAQIADSAKAYGRGTPLRVATVYGGTSIHRNRQDLARGVDILVATPGRLLDLVGENALSLGRVEVLVLDEADQMLDLGFIHALRRIARMVPRQRQTLLFSATMPPAIRELAQQFLHRAVEVSVAPAATTSERVAQTVTFVNQSEKQALLTLTLNETGAERVLVFTRTKHGADRVVRQLEAAGVRASAIHGNKSQPQRTRAIADFRSGAVPVLVATDIAARGIDIPGVALVVNFELPNVPEQYVHRIGRTARAGADGRALAFCADDERPHLKAIEKLTRERLEVVPLPDQFLAKAAGLRIAPAIPRGPAPKRSRTPSARPAQGARGRSRARGGVPRSAA
jgi:ATP-dependent RNA helicase RhlE